MDGVMPKATPEVSCEVDIVQVQEPQQQSVAMEQKPLNFSLGRMVVQQQGCPSDPNRGNIFRVAAAPAYAQQQYYFPQAITGSFVQTTLQHQYQGLPHHTGLQYSPLYQVSSATPQYIQTQPRMPSQMQQAHVGQQHVQQQHQEGDPLQHGPYPVGLLHCIDKSLVRVEGECLTSGGARSTSDTNPGKSNLTDELVIKNNGLELSALKISVQVNECGVADKIARVGRITYERDFLLKLQKLELSNVKGTIDIPDIAKDDHLIRIPLGNETIDNNCETVDKIPKKEIIKYDRDVLFKIEKLSQSRKRLEILIPDCCKDNADKKNFKREQSSKYKNNFGHINGLKIGEKYYKPLPNVPIAWPMMVPPPPLMGYPKIMESKSEVVLHKANDPWKRKPTGYIVEEMNEEQIIEDLGRKTKGLLNKLTAHNFDAIAESFKIFPVEDSPERILKIVEVIFGAAVAVTEPFTTTYAQLVQEVCKNCPEMLKMYQKELTNQCRREFQKLTRDRKELWALENELKVDGNVGKKQLKLELEFKKYWLRRRSLGFVIFIGGLYQLQMLSQHVVIEYVNMFLCSPDEENLECLCKLLHTVGKKLDESLRQQLLQLQHYEAKNLELLFRQEGKYMDQTFDKLNTLSQQKSLSSRIRFLLLNVVELRENDWTNRRKDEIERMAIQNKLEKALGIKRFVHFGGGDSQSTYPKSESSWNIPKNNQPTRFISKKLKQIGKSDNPFLSRCDATDSNPFIRCMQKPKEIIEHKGTDKFSLLNGNHSPNAQPVLDERQQKKNVLIVSNSTRFEGIKNITQPPYLLSIPERMDGGKRKMSTDAGIASFLPPPPPPRFLRFQGSTKKIASSPNTNVSNCQSKYISPKALISPRYTRFPPLPPMEDPRLLHNVNFPILSEKQDSSKAEYNGENTQSLSSMDVPATVKSFLEGFKERKKNEKLGETVFWIRNRFRGDNMYMFVEELSRQICCGSDEFQQTETGAMVRFLLKYNFVKLDGLINTLVKGFIQDLPSILIQQPEAITNVGKYLAEVFFESHSLDWLYELANPLLYNKMDTSLGMRFVLITGQFIRKRKDEEALHSLQDSAKR